MDVRIYLFPEQEIHMVGDYVGVCWRRKKVVTSRKFAQAKGTDLEEVTVTKYMTEGDPHIGFVWIRGNDDDVWVSEDNPTSGGMDARAAMVVAAELMLAVEYMRTVVASSSMAEQAPVKG